jgi:hypothetical protein
MKISPHGPCEWDEARRRAETYLRALRGRFGPTECEQVVQAIATARAQQSVDSTTHPVTLVMEMLFVRLRPQTTARAVTITPPLQRVSMLPEKTEFPFHEALRRLFRIQFLPFAGAR